MGGIQVGDHVTHGLDEGTPNTLYISRNVGQVVSLRGIHALVEWSDCPSYRLVENIQLLRRAHAMLTRNEWESLSNTIFGGNG